MPPQLEKNHVVPTAWQDEALARDGVSREVPCSALKGQIPYDYTVEVTNRLKGLDLIDRVPEELWTEIHDIVQKAGVKTIPKKKTHTYIYVCVLHYAACRILVS